MKKEPLIVVEGAEVAFFDAVEDAREGGWTIVSGWRNARDGVVCTGLVASSEDAAAALLAVVAGAGVVVHGQAGRETLDRLCDDLRRLGTLDHRTADRPPRPRLTRQQRELVDLLLQGRTLGEAARTLHLSRRTADRRLAAVRSLLRVGTTAEALVKLRRREAV